MKKAYLFVLVFIFSLIFFIADGKASETLAVHDLDIVVTTTAVMAIAEYRPRTYLLIQNKGPDDIYLTFDSTQTLTQGIHIPAGGNYEPYKVPFNSVWLRAATTSATVSIIRGR